jgi:hypothetical protein
MAASAWPRSRPRRGCTRMTRSETANVTLSAVALSIAIVTALFSWYTWRDSRSQARPYLNINSYMFVSRSNNGIQLNNAGLTPALIHNVDMNDNIEDSDVETAILDMNSVGFSHEHLIRHAFSQKSVVHPGAIAPLISIDREIGLTDVKILDRRFSALSFEICYCNVSGTDCWKYNWKYSSRDDGLRLEVPVEICA